MSGYNYGNQTPNPFSGNQQGFGRPNEIITIDMINGEAAAHSYWVAPSVTAFLMDFSNGRFYIKATDARGIPQPIRTFDFKEFFQQAVASNQPIPQQQIQPAQPNPEINQNGYVTQDQFEELKRLIIANSATATPVNSNTNSPRNNNKKGGGS